jgi:hypothetical protein
LNTFQKPHARPFRRHTTILIVVMSARQGTAWTMRSGNHASVGYVKQKAADGPQEWPIGGIVRIRQFPLAYDRSTAD